MPELLDGHRSREFLTRIFGTISSGELAVDGFFLISGYLIYQSYERSSSIYSYFAKRVKRIYPAFIVASIISIFVFAPLSAGWMVLQNMSWLEWGKSLIRLLILYKPMVDGVFASNPFATLNGAMWTIVYEFFCYLLVPLIAVCLHRKKLFLFGLVAILTTYILLNFFQVDTDLTSYKLITLVSAFMVGVFYYKFSADITWNKHIAMACVTVLLVLMFNQVLAEPALLMLGGYLLFYFAFNYITVQKK